jgi:hypothetical protein
MPSGFQQDANQLAPGMYRVVITMTSTTYYPTTGGAENDRGGVTPNSSDSFRSLSDPGGWSGPDSQGYYWKLPSTLAYGQNRARGNMRFRNIVNALTGLADCQIIDIEVDSDEAGPDNQATTLAFTVKFDRDAHIPLTGTYQGTTVVGNDIAGSAMDAKYKVIKNEIAKAIRLTTTANVRVYNGTAGYDSMLPITVTHSGATASQTLGTVNVYLIDGTELITNDLSPGGDAE